MPKLSDAMEEGRILQWLKKEGDRVQGGDILASIETDKAEIELESFGAGVLRKILVAEGETVPVGKVIAIVAEPDEDISSLVGAAAPAAPAAPAKAEGKASALSAPAPPKVEAKAPPTTPGWISPRSRAAARAAGSWSGTSRRSSGPRPSRWAARRCPPGSASSRTRSSAPSARPSLRE
jgi:pyruvate dehydrogenase E2 component (dihydrolipoamide acetyltransferase)